MQYSGSVIKTNILKVLKKQGNEMNEYLKKFISLKENYKLQDGNKSSVLALYQFTDRLSVSDEKEAKEVLVDVYQLLGMMESAYKLFSAIADKTDRKKIKKLANLQQLSKSHADNFALPRPLTEKEEAARRERLKDLPRFRYHPDPLSTGAFEEGEAKTCPCCGNKSTVYYSVTPYCIENVENLCPGCISNGEAARKYDASFIQDAEWKGEADKEKDEELFCRTPGYISWQGEYWLSCCDDYCAYLGTVGTEELKAMDIADEVFGEYAARNEFQDVKEYLVKDGSLCGYLFSCLHCGKYHLWVDAD